MKEVYIGGFEEARLHFIQPCAEKLSISCHQEHNPPPSSPSSPPPPLSPPSPLNHHRRHRYHYLRQNRHPFTARFEHVEKQQHPRQTNNGVSNNGATNNGLANSETTPEQPVRLPLHTGVRRPTGADHDPLTVVGYPVPRSEVPQNHRRQVDLPKKICLVRDLVAVALGLLQSGVGVDVRPKERRQGEGEIGGKNEGRGMAGRQQYT